MKQILLDERHILKNQYSVKDKSEAWNILKNRPEAAKDLVRLNLSEKDVLADLGCGSGYHSVVAAGLCKRVHSVDLSKEMIALLRKNIEDSGYSNIFPHLGGVLEIDYMALGITKVFTSGALHHLPDAWKGLLFNRLAHALPNGALFLLQDVIYSFGPSEMNKYQAQFREEVLSLHGPQVADDLRNTFEKEFPTFDWILTGLLERSGFIIKGIWSLPCKCWSCILCQKVN
jgi:SAM-dependent methyltransferase